MDSGLRIYDLLYRYASENGLSNTLLILDVISEQNLDKELFRSALSTVRLLSNLKANIDRADEDIMYAATVCSAAPELAVVSGVDPQIEQIVNLLDVEGSVHDDMRYGISMLQQNRIGMLIALASRGNAAEQLYNLSASEAMEYVRTSRKYYLPMCLYAKQNYPELQMTVNILLEKLRNLIDIAEIISNRYNTREMAYTSEIFSLMEDNARLRGMIANLEAQKNT